MGSKALYTLLTFTNLRRAKDWRYPDGRSLIVRTDHLLEWESGVRRPIPVLAVDSASLLIPNHPQQVERALASTKYLAKNPEIGITILNKHTMEAEEKVDNLVAPNERFATGFSRLATARLLAPDSLDRRSIAAHLVLQGKMLETHLAGPAGDSPFGTSLCNSVSRAVSSLN